MTAAVSVAEPCVLSCSGLGFAVRDAQLWVGKRDDIVAGL